MIIYSEKFVDKLYLCYAGNLLRLSIRNGLTNGVKEVRRLGSQTDFLGIFISLELHLFAGGLSRFFWITILTEFAEKSTFIDPYIPNTGRAESVKMLPGRPLIELRGEHVSYLVVIASLW